MVCRAKGGGKEHELSPIIDRDAVAQKGRRSTLVFKDPPAPHTGSQEVI